MTDVIMFTDLKVKSEANNLPIRHLAWAQHEDRHSHADIPSAVSQFTRKQEYIAGTSGCFRCTYSLVIQITVPFF